MWKLKMIWRHGPKAALEIFRVNARIAASENSSADAADCEYLETFTGRGWFGLSRRNDAAGK